MWNPRAFFHARTPECMWLLTETALEHEKGPGGSLRQGLHAFGSNS